MGHRIQKEFSPDRFKAMSRKMMALGRDLGLQKDVVNTINEDNKAIKKEQTQSRTAIAELAVDVGLMWVCIGSMINHDISQRDEIRKLRRENQALQKWLEGYIKLLFAIVVCFIIAVCIL